MKKWSWVVVLSATLLVVPSMAREPWAGSDRRASRGTPRTGTVSQSMGQSIARDLAYQSGWVGSGVSQELAMRPPFTPGPPFNPILDFEREVLVDDIAHYTALVQIGEGPYDVIRIHRVVKEQAPYQPRRTPKNVFLLHGDAVGFVKFLFGVASPSAPDDQAAAVYLAQNDVDVWGMDQDWILVPGTETDFTFMADWGLQHQVDNVLLGIEIARYVRLFTGNGFRKINLLGYSSGGMTAYAAANQETQLPRGHRHIGGLIPVDIHYKYAADGEAGRQFTCATADDYQSLIDGGVYADQTGALFQALGALAASDPDGDSPIIPGLTNLQTVLFFFGATHQVFPFNEWWHYMGTTFENGLPAHLEYTTLDEMLDFLATASPFEPIQFLVDYLTIFCDEADSPFDDHLAEISIPVLYLAAAGGVGTTGVYTTTLLGGDDVSAIVPSLRPPEEILSDIGHVDIWTSAAAEETFWQPLLEWINAH